MDMFCHEAKTGLGTASTFAKCWGSPLTGLRMAASAHDGIKLGWVNAQRVVCLGACAPDAFFRARLRVCVCVCVCGRKCTSLTLA